AVIERAKVPVLAIPEGTKFNGFKNIVYGSDFSPSDFIKINQLHEFAELFGAKIHVIHIADEDGYFVDDVAFNLMKDKYYEEFPQTKAYLDFKVLLGNDVENGLKDAVKSYKADLLAMTARKQNFFEKLFGKSDTKGMAYDTKIPLLAFQE
ncbi:MAG: nucleotide-binding universal stress UspA family protein, partial [Flammeovirgaceae bacterium]